MDQDHNTDIVSDGLSRRGFLRTTMVTGVLSVVASVPGVEAHGTPTIAQEVPSAEFDEVSLADLQEGMASGKYDARSITEQYLERIEAIDKSRSGAPERHPGESRCDRHCRGT